EALLDQPVSASCPMTRRVATEKDSPRAGCPSTTERRPGHGAIKIAPHTGERIDTEHQRGPEPSCRNGVGGGSNAFDRRKTKFEHAGQDGGRPGRVPRAGRGG